MMLQALLAYAERRRTEDPSFADPDFEPVKVAWLISLKADGTLAGVVPLAVKEGRKTILPQQRRPYVSVNEISVRSLDKAKSYFLCDTLERVLLYTGTDATSDDPLVLARAKSFRGQIRAAADTHVAEFRSRALLSFLDSEEQVKLARSELVRQSAEPEENVSFAVDGADLLRDQDMIAYWRGIRSRPKTNSAETAVCLVTGKLCEPVSTTRKVKGVGRQDTNLISSHERAFWSYGLEQAKNSPISETAEGLTNAALNELIRKGVRFTDSVYLHWTRKPVEFDPLDSVVNAHPEDIARLLRSVQEGKAVVGLDANAYYALSLSGNGARIVVRDWLESTVPEVERHVADWFKDLAIVPPEGINLKRDFKLGALLYGMVRAELDELPPQLSTQLLHAALRGTPLPQTALVAALRRQQLDQDNKLHVARLALIKACLLRTPTETPTPKEAMTECLNPDSRDPAYLCGRLFAVFDRLQYLALGGVNAGVVERFYASASSTPSLVMGRLFRNAQFHLAKAEGGIAGNARKDFEEITCSLGDKFPPSLTLEEQGRFALGYYHQKAEYRRRTAERKEAQSKTEANN
jgi:CRISPR-associated protein Csd1